jgi:hypothetical protein
VITPSHIRHDFTRHKLRAGGPNLVVEKISEDQPRFTRTCADNSPGPPGAEILRIENSSERAMASSYPPPPSPPTSSAATAGAQQSTPARPLTPSDHHQQQPPQYDTGTPLSPVSQAAAAVAAQHGLQALQAATAASAAHAATQYAPLPSPGHGETHYLAGTNGGTPAHQQQPETPQSSQKATRLRRACDMCSQRKVKVGHTRTRISRTELVD